MCQSPLVIYNKYNSSLYEVPCRYCLDCLIDRSKRYSRMLLSYKKHGYLQLFVTLTYSNSFVPYIRLSDLSAFFEDGAVPYVYRDDDVYTFKSHGKWKIKHYGLTKSFFRFPERLVSSDVDSLPHLVKYHRKGCAPVMFNDRVGVLLNHDVQRLFKSLRHHYDFTYYVVGEYGENTFRPHWHILFYLPVGSDLNAFRSLVVRYWKYCPVANMRFIKTIAVERYISMYVTKVSKLPSCMYHLQKSFVYYSREVGRSIPFGLHNLSKDLRYISRNKDGKVNSLLPSSRDFGVLVPVRKIPRIPLTWHSIIKSFYSPNYRRCYHPYRKLKPTLGEVIDYAITASELHNKLASEQLKEYLYYKNQPTIFSNHKLSCLHDFIFEKNYGYHPSTRVRYFLNNYETFSVRDRSIVNNFNYQQKLNQITFKNEY